MNRTITIAIWVLVALTIATIVMLNWSAIKTKARKLTTTTPGADGGIGTAASGTTGSGGTGNNTGGNTATGSGAVATDTSIPKALVDSIYNDLTCLFCTRNNSLYTQLMALDDTGFEKAYYYWDTVYSPQLGGYSMARLIADQSSFFNGEFTYQQQQLATRFSTLNLS